MTRLQGYLYNDAGEAIQGATVTALEAGTTTTIGSTDTTDSNGSWQFTSGLTGKNVDIKIQSGSSIRYLKHADHVQVEHIWARSDTAAGTPPARIENATNNASNMVLELVGDNSTRADGDEIYISFKLDDDGGNETEFARITAEANDVSNGSEDGELRYSVMSGGSLTEVFVMSSAVGGGTSFDITTSTVTMATDSFTIKSEDDGSAAILYLEADQGDDNADKWRVQVADGGTMTYDSYIGGSYATHLTVTPNSTASSSNVSLAGSLTLGSVAAAGTDTDKFLVLDSSGNVDYRTGSQVLSDIGAGTGSGDITGVTLTADDTNTASDTAGSADFTLAGGANITTSVSGTTVTAALDSSVSLTSSSANEPVVTITNTHADATAGFLKFVKDPGSGQGADNDILGTITFHGTDAGNNAAEELARMEAYVIEADHGSEAGGIKFYVAENDATMTAGLQILGVKDADGEIDVTIGAGAASTTIIAGTLTMGSTAAMTNAGLLSVANQSNVTGTGALSSGSISAGFDAIDNGTSGIRTDTFTAETSIVPDANGGADIGTTSLGWGDIFVADDKAIKFGDGQDASIEYDEDGTDQMRFAGNSIFENQVELAKDLLIDSSPADTVYSGVTAKFTAGEDLEDGEVVYMKAGDSKMWKAVSNTGGTGLITEEIMCVAMCVADVSADAVGTFLLHGSLRADDNFPTYAVGETLYVPEAETGGKNVPEGARPDSDGDFVQIVGWAIDGNTVYFNPDYTIIEHA